jgi:hypothetical protein
MSPRARAGLLPPPELIVIERASAAPVAVGDPVMPPAIGFDPQMPIERKLLPDPRRPIMPSKLA